MDIFYQFDDDIRTAHVLVPWMIAKDLKPGTPLTETGEVANDDTAYGLLINAGDVGEGVVKRNLGGGMTEVLPSQTVTIPDGGYVSQPLSNNGDLDIVEGTPATFTLDVNGYREYVTFDNDGWRGETIGVAGGETEGDLVFHFNPNVHDFAGDVTIAGYVEADESDIIPKQTARINSESPWTASLTGVNLDYQSPVPESFTLSINGETETLTCREWDFDSVKTYSWEGPHYSVEYSENWTLVALTTEGEEDISLPDPCVVSGYTGEGDSPLASPLLCINCEVMIAGYCDEKAAESSCGLEYTDALKGKLADIVFVDGEIGSGGGGGYLNVFCTFQNTKNGEIVNERTVSEDYATIESAVNNRIPVFVFYSSIDGNDRVLFTVPYGVLVRAYNAEDAPLTVTKQFVEYDHEAHSGTVEFSSITIYFNPQTNKTEYFYVEGLTAELSEP